MSRKILILFAHPSVGRSEVNREMFARSCALDGITGVDLYAEYPAFDIDIDLEQQRLREHDVLVFMFPLYWYSTPSILKEWQDLILEYGFAYGSEGTALHGKIFICSLTAGGPEEAYTSEGYNHYKLPELLRPLQQTAQLCGMHYIPPFALFGARTAKEDGKVERHIREWLRVLEALRDSELELGQVHDLNKLNDAPERLWGGAL